MAKFEPVVQQYMSYAPHSIDVSKTVQAAHDLMALYNIRHLPVVREGRLAGIVSDRDIKMAVGLVKSSPNLVLVDDICQEHPYTVSPDTKLRDVADEMAARRYGSVLVVQDDVLVGIFTTVDACKALSEIISGVSGVNPASRAVKESS